MEFSVGQSTPDWWDLVPAILGAVIGALAGGVPAYALAVRSSKEAANKENELLAERARAQATAIFLQFQSILNDSMGTLLMIEEMLADLKIHCDLEPYRIQRRVRPLANIDFLDYSKFSSNDLSVLLRSDKVSLLQDLILLSNIYNATLNSLRTYGRLKNDLYGLLAEGPEHQIATDGRVTSSFRDEQIAKLRLHEAQCESVIGPTIVTLRDLVDKLLTISTTLGDDLKASLIDDEKFLTFDPEHTRQLEEKVREARSGLEYLEEVPNVFDSRR